MQNQINKSSISLTGFIIAILGAIMFSTKAIIVKKAYADIDVPALTLLALRMIFSLPFYLLAAFISSSKKQNIKFTAKQWLIVFALGIFGYYISSFLDFEGLQYISAGMERLILFLYPTFAVMINAYWFKQKISAAQKWALAITYSGIALAYFGELNVYSAGQNFIWGSFLVFICSITFSIYIVGSGRMIPVLGASKFTAYAMLAATVGVLLHFAIAKNYDEVVWTKTLAWYAFLLAAIATVIPSFLTSFAIKKIGANNTAIITSIGPISTIMQANIFLGEKIYTEQIIGTVLVISGILIIGWKRKAADLAV